MALQIAHGHTLHEPVRGHTREPHGDPPGLPRRRRKLPGSAGRAGTRGHGFLDPPTASMIQLAVENLLRWRTTVPITENEVLRRALADGRVPAIFMFQPTGFTVLPPDRLQEWEE